MRFFVAVNTKLYFGAMILLSILSLLPFYTDTQYLWGLFISHTAIILNHILLVELTGEIIGQGVSQRESLDYSPKYLMMLLGKFAILFLGFYLGVHFMGNKVLIPLLNYIVLIFILVYSAKNIAEKSSQ